MIKNVLKMMTAQNTKKTMKNEKKTLIFEKKETKRMYLVYKNKVHSKVLIKIKKD